MTEKSPWDVLRINGVRGRLLVRISFYEEVSAPVHGNGELSESLMLVWVYNGCDVTITVCR